jgi:hypothetical protein
MSTDWFPEGEQDAVDLIERWDKMLSDAAKRIAYGWDATECSKVIGEMEVFLVARAECRAINSTANRLTKKEMLDAAKAAMRFFANAFVRFNPKMTDVDKLILGIRPRERTTTPKPAPTDLVELEISTISSDHRVKVRYRIAGSAKRGKGRYHGVEIRFWVRELHAPGPLDAEEDGWHSETDTRSPWEKTFPGADAGKRLYIMMRWENAATRQRSKGPWSAMADLIVP